MDATHKRVSESKLYSSMMEMTKEDWAAQVEAQAEDENQAEEEEEDADGA